VFKSISKDSILFTRMKKLTVVTAGALGVMFAGAAAASAMTPHQAHVHHVNHVNHVTKAYKTYQAPRVHHTVVHNAPVSNGESAARNQIMQAESSGNPNASNGQYHGLYQLGPNVGHGGYGSAAQQTADANSYVKGRYGSWQNALAFRNAHNWY
jgi:hypothetical protein